MWHLGVESQGSLVLYRAHLLAHDPGMHGVTKASGEQGLGDSSNPPTHNARELPTYPAPWTAPTILKLHLWAQAALGDFSLNPEVLYGFRLLVKQWSLSGIKLKQNAH